MHSPANVSDCRRLGGGPAITQVFMLSLILLALVIASPFLMQIAVDEVITRGDADLLLAMALGSVGLMAFSAAAAAPCLDRMSRCPQRPSGCVCCRKDPRSDVAGAYDGFWPY